MILFNMFSLSYSFLIVYNQVIIFVLISFSTNSVIWVRFKLLIFLSSNLGYIILFLD